MSGNLPDYLNAQDYRDWSEEGSLCPTKALLSALAAGSPIGGKTDAILYREYFEAYTLIDAEANLSSLERFDHAAYHHFHDRFYHSANPKKEPDWLTFTSPNDLNRLSALTDTDLVIFKVSKGKLPANPHLYKSEFQTYLSDFGWADDDDDDDDDDNEEEVDSAGDIKLSKVKSRVARAQELQFEVYHDYRCLYSNRTRERCFLLSLNGSRLFELDSSQLFDPYFASHSPAPELTTAWTYVEEEDLNDGGCSNYATAIATLLNTRSNVDDDDDDDDDDGGYQNVCDLWEIDEEHLYNKIGQVKCLVVYMVRRIKQSKRFQRRFVTLAVAAPHANSEIFSARISAHEPCPVVCVYNKRFLYLLPENERLEVLESHFNTTGRKERLLNRNIWLEGVDKKLPSTVLDEAVAAHEAKLAKKRKNRNLPPKLCRCNICSKDKKYSKNMDTHGPERLCSTKFTLKELLTILNCPPEVMGNRLEQLCELSIAAMDIESRTCHIDMKGPKPGPTVEYGEYDEAVLEGHVKKVQRPVMIAHTDAITGDDVWSLTVTDDSTDAIFDMMKEYWNRVNVCRNACLEQKKTLAAPLFKYLQEFETTYYHWYDLYAGELATSFAEEETQELEELRTSQHNRSTGSDNSDSLLQRMQEDAVKSKFMKLRNGLPSTKENSRREAWQSTLPGKAQVQLQRLIDNYTIFTFCG